MKAIVRLEVVVVQCISCFSIGKKNCEKEIVKRTKTSLEIGHTVRTVRTVPGNHCADGRNT